MATREELLEKVLEICRRRAEKLLLPGDELYDAIQAYDAGPKVPAHHCAECGEHGELETLHGQFQHAWCGNLDCGNYHRMCEELGDTGCTDPCPTC